MGNHPENIRLMRLFVAMLVVIWIVVLLAGVETRNSRAERKIATLRVAVNKQAGKHKVVVGNLKQEHKDTLTRQALRIQGLVVSAQVSTKVVLQKEGIIRALRAKIDKLKCSLDRKKSEVGDLATRGRRVEEKHLRLLQLEKERYRKYRTILGYALVENDRLIKEVPNPWEMILQSRKLWQETLRLLRDWNECDED